MNTDTISQTMEAYLANREISGGALLVRQAGEIVYQNRWGYADITAQAPIEDDSLFRMMSMTKPIIAAGVMTLVDAGRLCLDEPVYRYIPAFKDIRVADDPRYAFAEGMKMTDILPKLLFFNMRKVKSVPAQRPVTIRDLLSHSSGLGQGIVGLLAMMKDKAPRLSLAGEVEKYSRHVLDFQPGTCTGYSPIAGFDILARVIEVVSGQRVGDYLKSALFGPLEMPDTTFWPDAEQLRRLVHAYKREKGKLKDVTGTKADMDGVLRRGEGFTSGAGGLFSTLADYEHFAWMLCNDGRYRGQQILKPETVALMHTEAPRQHLEPEPGFVWGLGVKIRQDPARGGSFATSGTYGWSGAFGTHFFVSPRDQLDAVWLVNRTDLDGAGSYISNKVEELVFGLFTSNDKDKR